MPIIIPQLDGRWLKVEKAIMVKLGLDIISKDELYMPSFKCNLISTQKLVVDEHCAVSYSLSFCIIQDLALKMQIRAAELASTVYYLKNMRGASVFATVKKGDIMRWHEQLRHPSLVA